MKQQLPEPPVDENSPGRSDFPVVGIGASAGGLESLEQFFSHVPEDSGMAFVVVQHLSPDFKSLMDELLARRTRISIRPAEDGMVVEPNRIYLLPPKKEMTIAGGKLHLTAKAANQKLNLPIDHFFRSLADDCGRRSIAVIMSGTGSDGSRGILKVRDAGGLVLCEDELTAKFDGMPLAAQQTGCVDFVLPAAEMPGLLLEHVRSPGDVKNRSSANRAPELSGLEAVFELLRKEYDIDFSYYKQTTVGRRIEHRLALSQISDLDLYVARLRNDADELNALYRDLLIGVTKFFRDTEPFQVLEQEIVPGLLERVPPNEVIRVWIAGCATGEEAYSVAILLHEALERAQRPINVKIFATDVHRASLDLASQGLFDEEQLAEMSAARLRRYFTKTHSGYRVSQELRQVMIFARHNVVKDTPFTNMDLVSCRNLLIYFQPPAQKQVLTLFHFGLKLNGILMLGSSETLGELADEFDTLNAHCKTYRKRRDVRLPTDIRLPISRGIGGLQGPRVGRPAVPAQKTDADLLRIYDNLLDRYMPPSLLINEHRDLVDSFGGAEELLRVKGRRPSRDLLEMLDTDTKAEISGPLNRVMRRGQGEKFAGVSINLGGRPRVCRLEIEPIEARTSCGRHFLMTLFPEEAPQDVSATPQADTPFAEVLGNRKQATRLHQLEEELRYTKENLQATIEELETSNEEMQATNQELVSANEELQSTNEELHSVNEELYTVNAEHQSKIRELAELNQDMEHLLQSTDVAIIFLDRSLRIRKFTPRVAAVFDLVSTDIGRRISSFAHRVRHPQLIEELEAVLQDGQPRERQVRDVEGRCYFFRALPYRAGEVVQGVVLAMIDLSVLDETRSRVSHLSAIVESSQDAIISTNAEGCITSWNGGAERLYGYCASEVVGQPISSIGPEEQWAAAHRWFERLQQGVVIDTVEGDQFARDGKRFRVSLQISPIKDSDGLVTGASIIVRDISERERLEQRFRATIESAPTAMVMADADGTIVLVNAATERLFGYSRNELLGEMVELLLPLHSKEMPIAQPDALVDKPHSMLILGDGGERLAVRKNGSTFPAEVGLNSVETDAGLFVLAAIVDTTLQRDAAEKLREAIRGREQFLAMLSHELRNPLSAIRTATAVINSEQVDRSTDLAARRVIQRQSDQMARLLNDLLDVARITQDKIQLVPSLVDLRETIEDAVQSVRSLADECEVRIEINLPDEPLWVHVDVTRLDQIESNLLANAVKYSPAGATVWLDLFADDDHAVIRVVDQGIGIAPEMLKRIFDMFVQSDEESPRSHGGMGVGLTLVRKLVELHQGTVTAYSAGLGRGSQFDVRLPLCTPEAVPVALETSVTAPDSGTAPAANGSNSEPNRRRKAVLIEDQDDNRHMLAQLLDLQGIEVHVASDGRTGLALIDQQQPDWAIIDIGLPDIDGYEVARRVRACRPSHEDRTITLIALTGYGQSQDIERALDAGFDHHLVKPLQPDQLFELLSSPVAVASPSGDSTSRTTRPPN